MATFSTNNTKGKKEDLASFVSMITRDETPFISSIGSKKATSVYHEWQTDELAAPAANAKAEGRDFADETLSSTTRLGNYSQILTKDIKVSKTLDSVSKAGRNSEFAYQMKKKSTELKRDLEHALVGTRQRTDGSGGADTTTANSGRTLGGFQSWVPKANTWDINQATPAFVGSTGGGDGSTAAVASSAGTGTLALTDVDEMMQKLYEEGGKASTLMMSPTQKRNFSVLAHGSSVNTRRNIDDTGKLRQSVELYESDFGLVKVIPNYIQGLASGVDISDGVGGATDVLVYDPSFFALANLRALHTTDVGQKGDSTVGMLVEETTLECRNPAGSGLIQGVGTLVA